MYKRKSIQRQLVFSATAFLLSLLFLGATLASSIESDVASVGPERCEICDLAGDCELVEGTCVAGTDFCLDYLPPATCADLGNICGGCN